MSRTTILQGLIIIALILAGYVTFRGSAVRVLPNGTPTISSASEISSSKVMSTISSIDVEVAKEPEMLAPNYFLYQKGVLSQGKELILFFHAPWCPFCRQTDKRIRTLAATGAVLLPVYQVDYDTSEELKIEYVVLTQDTLVRVSAKGERLESIVHPTEEELPIFLRPFVGSSSGSSL